MNLDLFPPVSSHIVLVQWEHEPILWINPKTSTHADLHLAHPEVIFSGTFFPPQVFHEKFNKLRALVQRCSRGEISYSYLLARLGFREDERVNCFTEIEYKF
jgi:hypothetical protein